MVRRRANPQAEGPRAPPIREGTWGQRLDYAVHALHQLGYDVTWLRATLEANMHAVDQVIHLASGTASPRELVDYAEQFVREMYDSQNEQSEMYDEMMAGRDTARRKRAREEDQAICEKGHQEACVTLGHAEGPQQEKNIKHYGKDVVGSDDEEDSEETTMGSLSNSIGGGNMDGKRQRTDGDDPAQGGLDTIHAEGPIWTHFPNTQKSRLRYRATIYQNDQAAWVGNLIPFGAAVQTATSLLTTGGGNPTGDTSSSMAAGSTLANGYDFYNPWLLQVRMTSPYNIVKSIGDTTQTGMIGEPTWISFFDNMYQYYVCNETDWGVTLSFGWPRSGSNSGGNATSTIAGEPQFHKLKIFYRYTAQDDPPLIWSYSTAREARVGAWSDNQSTGGATSQLVADTATATSVTPSGSSPYPLSSDDYERMGGWHMKEVSFSTTNATRVHLGGKYKFGQCKMDIKTVALKDAHGTNTTPTVEGMSLSRTTPAFPELLSMIIVNDVASTANAGVFVPMSCQIDTNQQVDWCDLRANFKFPTPNCCNVAASEYTNEQYFMRGAANNS